MIMDTFGAKQKQNLNAWILNGVRIHSLSASPKRQFEPNEMIHNEKKNRIDAFMCIRVVLFY